MKTKQNHISENSIYYYNFSHKHTIENTFTQVLSRGSSQTDRQTHTQSSCTPPTAHHARPLHVVAGRRVWWRFPRLPSSSWARWGSGSRTPPSVRGLGAHTCLPSREGNWNNNHSDRCQFIKPSCVKVMFSVVSVHQSVIPSIGVRCDHYPWCIRSHLHWDSTWGMGSHCTEPPTR